MESSYSDREDVANQLIHGLGIVLSAVGLVVLVDQAIAHGTTVDVVAGSIFGVSLILVYTTSTLYHGATRPERRRVLRTLDHIAIFLLIAGTYTPFTLAAIGGWVGWTLFALIWSLALFGTVVELTALRRFRWLSVALYLFMGWVGVVAYTPLAAALGDDGLRLLLLGGVAYTLGVVFYLWRRLPYSHAIWHVFVLAGSLLHFFAVLRYIVQR